MSGLAERLADLSTRIEGVRAHLSTEEATKNAMVLPFLQALGYNPFDPTEVVPEFTADVGTKKGEKVDYAVMRDGQPAILVECKCHNGPLDEFQCSQLFRYFSVTPARIAILTDGVRYLFFTDLDKPNLMDARPYMEFHLAQQDENLLPELQKLSKNHWDLDATINAASELKYSSQIKRILAREMASPSEGLVRLLAGEVYDGRFTAQVREQFQGIVKRSLRQFVNDMANELFKSAMSFTTEKEEPGEAEEQPAQAQAKPAIETTEEEREAYLIVKAILRKQVECSRVTMRDTKSYCGVLLDDNNRKPLCRLHFNGKQKYLGIIADAEKTEQRVPIDSLDDIFNYAEEIRKAAGFWAEA